MTSRAAADAEAARVGSDVLRAAIDACNEMKISEAEANRRRARVDVLAVRWHAGERDLTAPRAIDDDLLAIGLRALYDDIAAAVAGGELPQERVARLIAVERARRASE